MTTLTIPRDRIRLDAQPGDIIVAIDGHGLVAPMEVHEQPYDQKDALRLRNRLGTDTVWNLYPDTQVERDITVERYTDAEIAADEAEEEQAEEALGEMLLDAADAQEAVLGEADEVVRREALRMSLLGFRVYLNTHPIDDDEKRHVRRYKDSYVAEIEVLKRDGSPTDLRSIFSSTLDYRGQPTSNRRYSVAGTQSHIFGQIASHHGWCERMEPYTYRLTDAGRTAIAYAAVQPYDLVERKIESLAKAVHNGAANPGLITRAGKIADLLDALAEWELADRLRVALVTRGESLGNRYERLQTILADFRKVSR